MESIGRILFLLVVTVVLVFFLFLLIGPFLSPELAAVSEDWAQGLQDFIAYVTSYLPGDNAV